MAQKLKGCCLALRVQKPSPRGGSLSDGLPVRLAVAAKRQGVTLPTNNRDVSSFRQVCRGRIYASRAVCPLGLRCHWVAGGACPAPTPLSPRLSLYGAHLYTLHKHFLTFFVAFQRAKTGDFPRCRAQNACIFLQGLYNKHYVPCARANVVFCGQPVERKERNFRLWMQFPRYVRSWPKSTIRSA